MAQVLISQNALLKQTADGQGHANILIMMILQGFAEKFSVSLTSNK